MSETNGSVTTTIAIDDWRPDRPVAGSLDDEIAMLGDVLHAVVHVGAGVSFVVPFSQEDGCAFWREKVLPGVRAGTRRVLVARRGARIVGTVQMDLATPPNQRHRAEVAKLLVHPDARRLGIARRLMIALEAVARSEGRTLLTLDTWTGGHAEQLYRSLGYTVVGVIPRFARGSTTPALEPTTIMYKELQTNDERRTKDEERNEQRRTDNAEQRTTGNNRQRGTTGTAEQPATDDGQRTTEGSC